MKVLRACIALPLLGAGIIPYLIGAVLLDLACHVAGVEFRVVATRVR